MSNKNNTMISVENVSHAKSSPHKDLGLTLMQQAKKTYSSNKNLLQEIRPGIFLFTITKTPNDSQLRLKKLCDKIQYSVLPGDHNGDIFVKLPLKHLKNLCFASAGETFSFTDGLGKSIEDFAHIIFYYHFNSIEQSLIKSLNNSQMNIKEKLSNNVVLISDTVYTYPLNLAILPAQALWQGQELDRCSKDQVEKIKQRFSLFSPILAALQTEFPTNDFHLFNGQMIYTLDGLTRPFDYASLCDDLIFANLHNNLCMYLKHFHLQDLDCAQAYPTVSIRSLIHLKARPQSMSLEKNGYAICAATDSLGRQTPTKIHSQKTKHSFTLWQKRSERYLSRHVYHARFIKHLEHDDFVIALIGEQITSIALFPALIRSTLETIGVAKVSTVNLVAHNEDILIIASKGISWRLVNEANIKADSLFKKIAADGSDPLTLFEQVHLPKHGVGTFNLREVPIQFFELLHTATNLKKTLPPGHDHYLLGLAYECIHEWGQAIAEFKKALRLDANDADILHALGSAFLEIGLVKEGYPFLKKAFAKLPQDAEVANNLGRISLQVGELADAIAAFERAVKLNPASADYLTNLGQGYLAAARPLDALHMLNKAIRCNPNFAHAHQTLAQLHISNGDIELAKKHALLAYKENPVDKNIANLLWRLSTGEKP